MLKNIKGVVYTNNMSFDIQKFINVFLNKLPRDIVINCIIPYTYSVQDKKILFDITNNFSVKILLNDIYYKYWVNYWNESEIESRNWLINDLFAYANNNNAIFFCGYTEKFYNIFLRNKQLNTQLDVDKYISSLKTKSVSVQINTFLGLLNDEERDEFVEESKCVLVSI
jgi:hypothetical protein